MDQAIAAVCAVNIILEDDIASTKARRVALAAQNRLCEQRIKDIQLMEARLQRMEDLAAHGDEPAQGPADQASQADERMHRGTMPSSKGRAALAH